MADNSYEIKAFYQFVDLPDRDRLADLYKAEMLKRDVKGTILVTPEGINGTISAKPDDMAGFMPFITDDARFKNMPIKTSHWHKHAFLRTKVKRKDVVVDMNIQSDPREQVGDYVKPKEWNDFISRDDVITIDTRNDYEIHLGTFKGAVDPHTDVFKDIPQYVASQMPNWKDKKVAMYCTGGVRCERFSSYLKELGVDEVYHLEGGILKYLEEVPESESLWEGSCFVFDDRVAVDHGMIANDDASICPKCNHTLGPQDVKHRWYIKDEQCPYCIDPHISL